MAALLDAEGADIVTGYDWCGGYGHPDHVMVHRIVRRAVELAVRRPRLLEVTMNRDGLPFGGHARQTTDVGMMLALPQEVFIAIFRDEYSIEPGRAPGLCTGWILDERPTTSS